MENFALKNADFVGRNPVQLISKDCTKIHLTKVLLRQPFSLTLFHFKVMELYLDKQHNF